MANNPAARRRRARTKKGLHLTMKAFYFLLAVLERFFLLASALRRNLANAAARYQGLISRVISPIILL
jgi:hypothetical protein